MEKENPDIIFVNPTDKKGKAEDCNCILKISDGCGQYPDVYYVKLCPKHKKE